MNRRYQASSRPGAAQGLAIAVALLAIGLPSAAAELLKVRAGAHPGYTRIVFELDRAAGYRVEKVGSPDAPELRVTVEAASAAHDVGAHGDVGGVKVAPGRHAVARIPLRRSGLRLQEMILANPPRIVLDLRGPEPVAKTKPAVRPVAKAKPVVKPEPAVAPAPKPAPVAKTPAPAPVAKTTVPPKPAPVAKTPVAPKPAPVAKTPVAPEPEPVAKTPVAPEPEPAATPGSAAPKLPASPEATVAQPTTPSVPPRPALLPPGEPWPPPSSARPQPRPAPERVARPSAPSRPAETRDAEPAEPGWMERLSGDPIWLGAAAGGLVALIGIAITLRRRRQALPGDLDVDAISDELDDEDDESSAVSGTATEADESSFGDLFTASDAATAETPVGRADTEFPAPAVAGSEFDVEAPVEHSNAPDSIFQDASPGEAPMNQEIDLPADPTAVASPPPPPMGGASVGASGDVAQMLEAFERRMAGLEAKLEEANEAREKLERQVAAQSEELRVQRAAIARTQRALRTMSRGDEDKATEPALRSGDTQS